VTRFFFDLVKPNARSIDFHGRYFSGPKDAHEHAQVLSMDLGCMNGDEWEGAEVEVRNDQNCRLFSVPVTALEEAAA
jgi:hypothetical protein